MGLVSSIMQIIGVSKYEVSKPSHVALEIDDPIVEDNRKRQGGQLSPMHQSRVRWYQKDIERAQFALDSGELNLAAQLMREARGDGVYAGVLSTRTSGLVGLPKIIRGHADAVCELERRPDESRSVFDEMFPARELALLLSDGIELGVGVAELLPMVGRTHPRLTRLDPQFLRYVWAENRWYYHSITGMLPVTPGDGRWVLYTPGGAVAPWNSGLWRAIGRAYIRKQHAQLHKDNWEAKLANPARVAVSPQGASEEQRQSWFRQVMAWGKSTVFGMTPGYDVKLLESNGRGYESFRQTIEDQNEEIIIAVAGQTVTTDGGTGFANADIHKSIRGDLIRSGAESLAEAINTQALPWWAAQAFGHESLRDPVSVRWDVDPPKDRAASAQALKTASEAVTMMTRTFADHGLAVDARELALRFGIPLVEGSPQLVLDVERAIAFADALGLRVKQSEVIDAARRIGVPLEKSEGAHDDGSDAHAVDDAPLEIAA